MSHYKGRGNHSVQELEQMLEDHVEFSNTIRGLVVKVIDKVTKVKTDLIKYRERVEPKNAEQREHGWAVLLDSNDHKLLEESLKEIEEVIT